MTINKSQPLVGAACSPVLCESLPQLLPLHAVLELELSRQADVAIKGLWVSSSGEHTVISLQLGIVPETHYLHASWKKSRVLSKLKGVAVSCVAWNKQKQSGSTTG